MSTVLARLGRRTLLTALIAALAFAAGAAAIVRAETSGIIYACVNNGSGTIHIISATGTCSSNEMRLTWNQQGPAGPAGPQGPAGPPGPPGGGGGSGTGGTGTIVGYLCHCVVYPDPGLSFSISGTNARAVPDPATGRWELTGVPVGVYWTISVRQVTEGVSYPEGQYGVGPGTRYRSYTFGEIPEVKIDYPGQVVEIQGVFGAGFGNGIYYYPTP